LRIGQIAENPRRRSATIDPLSLTAFLLHSS